MSIEDHQQQDKLHRQALLKNNNILRRPHAGGASTSWRLMRIGDKVCTQRRTTCHSAELRRIRREGPWSDFPLLSHTSPCGMTFARERRHHRFSSSAYSRGVMPTEMVHERPGPSEGPPYRHDRGHLRSVTKAQPRFCMRGRAPVKLGALCPRSSRGISYADVCHAHTALARGVEPSRDGSGVE
jgi:hypothetical protein